MIWKAIVVFPTPPLLFQMVYAMRPSAPSAIFSTEIRPSQLVRFARRAPSSCNSGTAVHPHRIDRSGLGNHELICCLEGGLLRNFGVTDPFAITKLRYLFFWKPVASARVFCILLEGDQLTKGRYFIRERAYLYYPRSRKNRTTPGWIGSEQHHTRQQMNGTHTFEPALLPREPLCRFVRDHQPVTPGRPLVSGINCDECPRNWCKPRQPVVIRDRGE